MKSVPKTIMIIFLWLFALGSVMAQPSKMDSLKKLIQAAKEDSNKVILLNSLAYELRTTDAGQAFSLGNQALKLAEGKKYERGIVRSDFILGITSKNLGNYSAARDYLINSLELSQKNGLQKSEADADNGLGNVFYFQGNYSQALIYFFDALKIYELLKDKKGIGIVYIGIGLVYDDEGNLTEALKNYNSSLKIRQELGDKYGIATAYNNIGLIYATQGKYTEALTNHFAALKLREEINYKEGIADSYVAIGVVYQKDGNYSEAYKNYSQSLSVYEELGNKQRIAMGCTNLGELNIELKNFPEAEKYLTRAFQIAKEIGNKESIKACYFTLAKLDSAEGNFQASYEKYKMFVVYKDSLSNEQITKKTVESQMNYEFDKKEAARLADQVKKDAVAEADKNRQQVILWFVIGGLILVVAFAAFIYRSFLQKQKTNVEITLQKQIVEEKQKEILDSIHYAKRIQQALLTSEKYIEKNILRLKNKS
jgi:tetratricopeptide (TPR) repeat protein